MRRLNIIKLLAFPIIVGLVIVGAQYAVEKYKTTRKVSAVIEGPLGFAQIQELFDTARISFKIELKGRGFPELTQQKPDLGKPAPELGMSVEVKVDDLQLYKVTIKNTGNSPIKDLPIRLVFENAGHNFKMLGVKHKPNPAVEFGEIKEDFSELSSPRFVYQLLNPGDEDVITILASEKRDLKAYSKAEGVTFDAISASDNSPPNPYLLIIGLLVGIITGMIGGIVMLLRAGREYKIAGDFN